VQGAPVPRGCPDAPEDGNDGDFWESGRLPRLRPSVFLGRNLLNALSFQVFRSQSGRKNRAWGSG
jgi:hypothetical protein